MPFKKAAFHVLHHLFLASNCKSNTLLFLSKKCLGKSNMTCLPSTPIKVLQLLSELDKKLAWWEIYEMPIRGLTSKT